MNDIIDNYKKRLEDSKKKTVNGTLNINLKDIDIKSKNFQIAANNNYYDKSNVHVELNNNFNSINMDNGLTTLNIVIVIDKKIILSKNIHKLNNNIILQFYSLNFKIELNISNLVEIFQYMIY